MNKQIADLGRQVIYRTPTGFVVRNDDRPNADEKPISADLAFALGTIFGCFEPFDGGRDTDGTRLIFTRQMLLEEAFGKDWQRYARATVEITGEGPVPFKIKGLPRRKPTRAPDAQRSIARLSS